VEGHLVDTASPVADSAEGYIDVAAFLGHRSCLGIQLVLLLTMMLLAENRHSSAEHWRCYFLACAPCWTTGVEEKYVHCDTRTGPDRDDDDDDDNGKSS
jgi:hypothetical protein